MAKLFLVNNERNIRVPFEANAEPRDILRVISDSGNAGSIGLLQLRALLGGSISEHAGFIIISEEEAGVAGSDAVMEEAAKDTAQTTETTETAVETETETTETTETAVNTETTTETETTAETAVVAETTETTAETAVIAETTETTETTTSAKDALKKTFGIDVSAGGDLTPKTDSNPVKRPRRDMAALVAKAKAGKHKELLEGVEKAGFGIFNVQSEERWFCLVYPGFEATDRNAPRLDVSPLKNGSYSLSLYISDRSQNVKFKVEAAAAGTKVEIAAVVAAMHDKSFVEAIAAANYVKQ